MYVIDFYMKGLSYKEIAEKRKVEKKNVEMKLYRARSWLKEILEEGGMVMHISKEKICAIY